MMKGDIPAAALRPRYQFQARPPLELLLPLFPAAIRVAKAS